MPSKQYPFIDIAVHEGVRARFAAGEALVLFSDDMEKVLWANGAGAGLFSHDFIYDFLDAGLPSSDVTTRQIRATAGQLQKIGDKRSFLMRITTNFQRVTIQANLELLTDRGGDLVILFSAATSEKPLPLSQRAQLMLSGFDDPDTHMAVLGTDGSVLASSPDFSNLGMTRETLLAFVKAVSRDADQLVKRPVPTGRGYLPAAIGKLSDDPALHLLFCVETAIGQMDPTDDDTFVQGEQAALADQGEATLIKGTVEAEVPPAEELRVADQNPHTAIEFSEAIDAVSHIEDAPDEPVEQDAIVESEHNRPEPVSGDRPIATGLQMLHGDVEDDMSLSYANETADDLADLSALHALDSTPYNGVPDVHALPTEFEAEFQAFSQNDLPLVQNFVPVSETDGSLNADLVSDNSVEHLELSPEQVPTTALEPETGELSDVDFLDNTETEAPEITKFAALTSQVALEPTDPALAETEEHMSSGSAVASEYDSDEVDVAANDIDADAIFVQEVEQTLAISSGATLAEPADEISNGIVSDVDANADLEDRPELEGQDLVGTFDEPAMPADVDVAEPEPTPEPAFQFQRNSRPVRFVWKVDASGKFSEISEEFAQAVGPRAAAINDLYFADVARAFKMDADGKIGDLLQKRDTWSGKTIYWPVEGTSLKVPVDLAALPTYSRSRSFDGFRGFGIVRLVDAVEDPDQIGTTLGKLHASQSAEQENDASETTDTVVEDGVPLDATPKFVGSETFGQSLETVVASVSSEVADATDPVVQLVSDETSTNDVRASTDDAIDESEPTFEIPADPSTHLVGAHDFSVVTDDTMQAEQPLGLVGAAPEVSEEPLSADNEAEQHEEHSGETELASSTLGEAGLTEDHLVAGEISEGDLITETVVSENADALVPVAESVVDTGLVAADGAAEANATENTIGETNDRDTDPSGEEANTSLSNDNNIPPVFDEFHGEKPALRIVENPGRRLSDKVISIDAHRGKSREGLTLSEQAAFQEIARQLDPLGKRLPQDNQKDQSTKVDGPSNASVADESLTPSADLQKPEPEVSDENASGSVLADQVSALIPSRTKSEEQLSAGFVDGLPLAILVHTGENLIHANPEFFRLTGYESLEQLRDYGGLDALLERDQSPRSSDEAPAMLMVTAHGTLEPVTARLQSIRWEDSHALLLALVPKRAESEREAAAKAAAENNQFDPEAKIKALTIEVDELRSILETATDGVVIVGQDGDIRSMNKSASALFNFDEEDTRGKSFAMLFAHESQKAVMDYLSGLSGHGVASVLNDGREVIGRESSGGFIPLFMTMGRLSSSNGYCAVIRDITQWKRTEEELRTAKRAAETANAHKSEFLARVSHEIRTPLNAIIGFSDMMATERLGPIGHPRYVEYSDDIGRSGRHVLDIVNDLLDISKIEAGEMELEFTAVELNEAVSEAVSLVQPQVNSQRVIIRTSLSQSVPNIVADQRSIKQIAINILANAIRYTPSGGQIVVSTAYEPNGSVVLRIRDTGVGMTRTELEQALKPFRQVTTGSRKRGDGTGLGLPLTKAMVDANRANFAISSAPNEGTLVEITFPSPRVLAN